MQPSKQRSFYIPASASIITLDSLSIIEESFQILGPDKETLDTAFYSVDFIEAEIKLRVPEFWHNDSLRVSYNVYSLNFAKPYSHKDTSWISLPGPGESFRPITASKPGGDKGLLDFPELNSSGSITRGVSIGNRQDLSLNSAMNLQLSGNLTDEIEVNAVISDQDIPVQPEGTTQQLQEFDKVFIQMKAYNASLIAGDFEIDRPKGYFMNFSRKAQGGKFNYQTPDDYESNNKLVEDFDIEVSGSISKGLYARNVFKGMEGNQGPYRLTGNNAESYIIVLAGTEKVFIDGELLVRGMENDYVMNYNQAELTFTSQRLITANSRITVEFEYAARDYVRSMYSASGGVETKYGNLRVNFFSEQDHPGQPLFKEISDEQKDMMAAVGDSIHKAFSWNFDSIGFKNDRTMYLLTDSLGYDTVFVYSTDPDRAHYQVGFSYMGEGKGNYRQINSSANGRVFQWVAPVNNEPQGTHEPIQLLTTPQKSQMLSIAYDIDISKNTNASLEWALSNNDINLFSELDNRDNVGMAIIAGVKNKRTLGKNKDAKWVLFSEISHETASKTFNPIERYRSVEFEMDWNLTGISRPEEEHFTQLSLLLENKNTGQIKYNIGTFFKGDLFSGLKNSLLMNLSNKKNKVFYSGSFLESQGWQNTSFYRHNAGYTRVFRYFNIGFIHQMENNKIRNPESEELKIQSLAFNESEIFISNNDTATNNFRLFYKFRQDYLPETTKFALSAKADEYGATYEYRANSNQRIKTSAIYRKVKYTDYQNSTSEDDNNISGRIEYLSKWANGAISSSMFYEAASGMERKQEYIFVEVPAGQGIYTWNDYNENGIMELDEFEIAQYSDQANFIKVFVPTDDFIKAFTNIYSHTLNINPMLAWKNENGFKKFLARFSNQTSYSVNKKILEENSVAGFNPFSINLEDTLISSLRSSLKNSLFFNRINPVFSLELTYHDDRNKMLLSNGFETRHRESLKLTSRWNINRQYAFNLILGNGTNKTSSEFFVSRNFIIQTYTAEPTFIIQFSRHFRTGFFYRFQHKKNEIGEIGELATINSAGIDSRANFPGNGSLSFRFQISQINYPFDENTPVAFDMLESLRPGTNQLWNLSWQQNLNEYLMLILNYHGRKSPGTTAVHTGNVQVRAFF